MEVNKASPKDDIPLKIIKSNYDIFAPLLCNDFNLDIDNNKFPDALKTADIKPSFKLDDRQNKVNYRPVSLLSVISEVYEKVLYGQINEFLILFFLPFNVASGKGMVFKTVCWY